MRTPKKERKWGKMKRMKVELFFPAFVLFIFPTSSVSSLFSCTSVFPNTCAWEQLRNRGSGKDEKNESGKKYSGREKKSSDRLTVARAHRLPGVATPEVVEELPNELNNTYYPSSTTWGGNTIYNNIYIYIYIYIYNNA